MKRFFLSFLAGASLLAQVQADDMTDAFGQLVAGRAYLKDYPLTKTRRALVDDFVGANGQTANHPNLMDAINRAITIRAAEPADPPSFSGTAPRSLQAREIAWQALEASGTGYLFAGNKDLLDGIRIAYPGSNAANDTRALPRDEPATYAGTSQKQLAYSLLYFLQPIKDTLSYMSRDKTGAVRAGSNAYPTLPHYVTFDDQQSQVLPFDNVNTAFDDPNFGGPAIIDKEASQSGAYLFGSSLERLGMAVVSYADQLWRSAYSGPTAGVARPAAEKQAMLDRATDALKSEIHAQFLATLPMAAQLADGADNTANEFTQSRIDQARVSVTDAQRLRDQILSGEKPLQTTLVSAWDTTTIEGQISICKDAYNAANIKYSGASTPGTVEYEIAHSEAAADANFNREITLRTNYETRLLEITGVDPSGYGGLRTDADRVAYLEQVNAKFLDLVTTANDAAVGLNDGSLMSNQALRLIQANKEIFAAKTSIDLFVEEIRIVLESTQEINAVITIDSQSIAVMDFVIGIADSTYIGTSGSPPGPTLTTKLLGYAGAIQSVAKGLIQASERVTINTVESNAKIKNILIEQQKAINALPAIQLNGTIAIAELQRLFNEAKRLVEDHIFYQDLSNTLWYRDPGLPFKMEKAEEEYQDLVQIYRIELYKLSKMLEMAWTEPFRNPVKKGSVIAFEALDNGNYDDFTEPESVFGTPNHVRGLAFFNALKKWDLKLRDPVFRGAASTTLWDVNIFSGQPLSMRRDIFKLIDYRYDLGSNTYVIDPALTRDSIQKFRAILLDKAARDSANASSLTRLRLDFPLTYQQARVIGGQSNTVPIVQRNPVGNPPVDTFWNHRIKEVGIKIVGKNVFAGGTTVPVALEHYGNVDRVGFFLDSAFTNARTVSSFQVPLYQRDPDKRLVGEPYFGTSGIPAAIGSTAVPMNQVSGWPLFCDNYVLRIGNASGTMRIENIEDIEFTLRMEVGSPPPINSTIW